MKSFVRLAFGLLIGALLVFGPYVLVFAASYYGFVWVCASFTGWLRLVLAMVVASISSGITVDLLKRSMGEANMNDSLDHNSLGARWFWHIAYLVIGGWNWISKFLPYVFSALIVVAYFTQSFWVIVASAVALWILVGNYVWNK